MRQNDSIIFSVVTTALVSSLLLSLIRAFNLSQVVINTKVYSVLDIFPECSI